MNSIERINASTIEVLNNALRKSTTSKSRICIFWLARPKKGEEGKAERLERNVDTHLKGKGGGMCIFTLKVDFELL